MFAIDAAHELLFEKGWPHLRSLLSPHPHEKDAGKWAGKALRAYDPNVYFIAWPREVAYRYVRAMGAKRPDTPKDNIAFPDQADEARLLATPGPVDEQEARAIVAHVTDPRSCHKERAIEDLLLLLEAMVGPEPVLDAALLRLESMTKKDFDFYNPHDLVYVPYYMGFLLHRLPDKAKHKHRARMEKLRDGAAKGTSVGEKLLIVTGGVKGIEESGYKPGLHIAHFVDDPSFLVMYAGEGDPDVLLAYRAGDQSEKVLEAFAKKQRKIEAWRLPFWVDELAAVGSSKATAMLRELASKKAVARKVEEVLATRGGKKPSAAEAKKPPPKPLSKKAEIALAEKRFEELSAWVASELQKVRGKAKREAAVLEEATKRYADIRTDIGQDPTEAVVHFFAADGCGYGKQRTPAFLRVKPTDEELKRWVAAIS